MSGIDTPSNLGPLEPGERLECQHCGHVINWLGFDPTDWPGSHEDCCPDCERYGTFVRQTFERREPRTVRFRWPHGIADSGWWPVPDLLTKYAGAIGLDAADVGLMSAFGNYQHNPSKPVWPGYERVAAEIGLNEKTVRRRVDAWTRGLRKGLWERRRRKDARGMLTTNELRPTGILDVLAAIAENLREDREPTYGLEAVLEMLRQDEERTGQKARTARSKRPEKKTKAKKTQEKKCPGGSDWMPDRSSKRWMTRSERKHWSTPSRTTSTRCS